MLLDGMIQILKLIIKKLFNKKKLKIQTSTFSIRIEMICFEVRFEVRFYVATKVE